MFGKILGVVIAVLAVVFVIYVVIKSAIDRKNGKNCCCNCSSCAYKCSMRKVNDEKLDN